MFHVDALDLAGSISERERTVVLGQTDAKNPVSYNCVEARGGLGADGTNQGN